MRRAGRILCLALASSAIFLCPRGLVEAPASGPDIVKMIKGANSQERYEALARYYEEEAAKAHKEAQNYKAQYECYVEQEKANKASGIKLGVSKLSSFCYRERSQYLDIAKENEALAKMYHDMAHEVAAQQSGKPAATK
jgi:hypothetical protein